MTDIERLTKAVETAKDTGRARRQLLLAIDLVEQANRAEATEQALIAAVKRVEDMAGRPRPTIAQSKGRLTSQQAAEHIGICRASLSMLVAGGHLQPVNADAPNGAPHYFHTSQINNFLDQHSSGEISRMIAAYRTRPR